MSTDQHPAAGEFDDVPSQELEGALNHGERQELAELRGENERLRVEVAELREQRRQAGRAALAAGRATITAGGFAARFVAWFAIGRGLTEAMLRWLEAIRGWIEAKAPADSIPIEETADVAVAVIRHRFRVGLWRLALASGGVITAGILIWQGLLIRDQIEEQKAQVKEQRVQNELFREQIEQQNADTLIVRRAQLLDTIYTEECGESEDPETCKPKAHPRARAEAVQAFVKIEHGRGATRRANLKRANLFKIGLSGADLRRADLREANLHQADLRGANLIQTDLIQANLSGASLIQADLKEAFLQGANLRWANFRQADLRGANLRGADLSGVKPDEKFVPIAGQLGSASLHGANLSGANLREANLRGTDLREANLSGAHLHRVKNLTPKQLATACGDETTILPHGWRIPETWPCPEEPGPEKPRSEDPRPEDPRPEDPRPEEVGRKGRCTTHRFGEWGCRLPRAAPCISEYNYFGVQIGNHRRQEEEPQNKRMQGTLQPYLPSVAGAGLAASPKVNS